MDIIASIFHWEVLSDYKVKMWKYSKYSVHINCYCVFEVVLFSVDMFCCCFSKLRVCRLPSTVGNTLTVDNYLILPHFKKPELFLEFLHSTALVTTVMCDQHQLLQVSLIPVAFYYFHCDWLMFRKSDKEFWSHFGLLTVKFTPKFSGCSRLEESFLSVNTTKTIFWH